jgi:hypothetical protein
MDKAKADKKAVEGKQAMAAVAASQESTQVVIGSENGTVNVLPLGGNAGAVKSGYHVTKNPDGSFKVHSMSTNATTNAAIICPTKKNESISTCVVLTFNADQTQVLSTKNVTFTDQLGTGFNVASVTDLALPQPA